MPQLPRRLVITLSALLTLGWSLAALVLMYAAGMAALLRLPSVVMDTAGPIATAVAVVLIAAAAGVFSVTGIWVFGGPALHALEVWQADRLARGKRPASMAAGYTSERRLYLA